MKRVMFIGQAMPRSKSHPHDWPSLNKWLYSIGITDLDIKNNFYYSALVDYFPGSKNGSHLVPTPAEILKEKPRLYQNLLDFKPEIIVPIGKLSIAECLCQKLIPLNKTIGQSYFSDPYHLLGRPVTIIPLPHPSGASTWRHHPANKILLNSALNLIRQLF